MRDLNELPRLRDSLSYLYIEKAILERDENAIVILRDLERIPVPISSLTVLLLGPGVSVTQPAIRVIAESGCMAIWCGEGAMRFYAYGMGETRSAGNLMRQAEYMADPEKHMRVVRGMYALRFSGMSADGMTLQQMRGIEGVRMREAYRLFAKRYHVKWNGRVYKLEDWDAADDLNRALSAANVCLYGLCNAAIVSLGYSPGLGFIHTGKMMSFTYDVADLYKLETTIPAAFEAVSTPRTDPLDRHVRKICRRIFRERRILKRIAVDLSRLFDCEEGDRDANMELPGDLWDTAGSVDGGINYADQT